MEVEKLKPVWNVAKVALTALILWLVFRHLNLRLLAGQLNRLDVLTLLLLFITTLFKFGTDSLNWLWCLRLDPSVSISWPEAMRTHTIGMALRFAAPGGAATLGKVFFVNNRPAMAVLAVGVERFLIFWTSILYAVLGGVLYFSTLSLTLRLGVLAAVLAAPLVAWLVWRLAHRGSALPGRYLAMLPRVLLMRSIFILLTCLQYWLILRRMGGLPFAQALISVPVILSANNIPVTVAGLGLRETFAVNLLARYGLPPEAAVTASLTVFVFNGVLPALPGLVFMLLHKKRG